MDVRRMNTFVCRQCRMNIPETFATGITQEQASNALGTDFAKFRNFGEYAWHMANIHHIQLKKTQANGIGKSVTALTECDCFAGKDWGQMDTLNIPKVPADAKETEWDLQVKQAYIVTRLTK